jgi:hypothetical protein
MTTYQLTNAGVLQVNVQTLTLADECTTVRGHVNDLLLTDLPDGLVDSLDVVGNSRNLLNGTAMGNDHVLHLVIPELEVNELTEEPWAHDLEFTSEHTASVDVARG